MLGMFFASHVEIQKVQLDATLLQILYKLHFCCSMHFKSKIMTGMVASTGKLLSKV